MQHYDDFINGEFRTFSGRDRIEVRNHPNGTLTCTVLDSGKQEMDEATEMAETAQCGWAKFRAVERSKVLRSIAAKIRERIDMTDYSDYTAECARRIESEILESDRPGETILLFRQPIGVVGGILTWNFPYFLIARKVAPVLLTGNTIVSKPSEETSHNAVEFCEILKEVGVLAGIINIVHDRGALAGHAVASSHTGLITFTGSVQTCTVIMRAAADHITEVNLELRGKAPVLVMADADIDLAVRAVKASRIINSGQACNCVERLYVQNQVAEEFANKLTIPMKVTRYGDSFRDESVEYRSLINEGGYQKVDKLVQSTIAQCATPTMGRKRGRDEGGFYYESTVLTNCRQDMEIIRNEIFGPVVPNITFNDLEEAIHFAHDSEYGLIPSIYTCNLNIALEACQEIRSGETYINRKHFEAMEGFHAGWL